MDQDYDEELILTKLKNSTPKHPVELIGQDVNAIGRLLSKGIIVRTKGNLPGEISKYYLAETVGVE